MEKSVMSSNRRMASATTYNSTDSTPPATVPMEGKEHSNQIQNQMMLFESSQRQGERSDKDRTNSRRRHHRSNSGEPRLSLCLEWEEGKRGKKEKRENEEKKREKTKQILPTQLGQKPLLLRLLAKFLFIIQRLPRLRCNDCIFR